MNQACIEVRPVADNRIQITRIVVFVTTAGTVHRAETRYWQRHVLIVLPPPKPVVGVVGSSGTVAEAIRTTVWIVVSPIQPDAREDDGCCPQPYGDRKETAR